MDINEAKEVFADILISYQRGELDLADALAQVREMGGDEADDDNEEVPEYDEDDEDVKNEDVDDGSPVDEQAELELDAALELVADL